MKKTIALLISVLLVFSLASCSFIDSFKEAENKPEDVVGAYLDALKKADIEAMDSCYYNVESSDEEVTREDLDIFKAVYGNVSYEILGTETDGAAATVKVKVSKTDYQAAVEEMTNVLAERISNGELDAETLTEEDTLRILKMCLRDKDTKTLTRELEVKCVRVGARWYLDAEDDSLETFMNEGMDA